MAWYSKVYKYVDKSVFKGKLPGGYIKPTPTKTTTTTTKSPSTIRFTPSGPQSYDPNQPQKIAPGLYTPGGGGGGGGGSSSVSNVAAQAQATSSNAATQSQAAAQRQAQIKVEAQRQAKAEAQAQKQRETETVIRSSSSAGGVRITTPGAGSTYQRTSTYHGNIVVPGTGGLTANQYRRLRESEARKKFNIKPGDRVGYRSEQRIVKKEVVPVSKKVSSSDFVIPSSNNLFYRPNDIKIINKKGGFGIQNDPITSSYLLKDGEMVYSENPYTQFDAKFFGGYLPGGKPPKEVARINEVTESQETNNIPFDFGEGNYYNEQLSAVMKPYAMGQGTSTFVRSLTAEEQNLMTQRDIRAGAIMSAVPVVGQAKFFDYKLTGKQEQDIYGGSTLSTIGKFVNPVYQYNLGKDQEQLRLDIIDYTKNIAPKLDMSYANLISSGITEEQISSGNITQQLTPVQEKAIMKYNMYVDYAKESEAMNRLSTPRRSSFEIIATSPSKTKRVGATALITGGQTVPYFSPVLRIPLGLDITLEGGKAYETAETKGQKWMAGGQIALGGLVAYSGLKGVYAGAAGASTGTTITGSATKLKIIKYGAYTAGTGLGVGIGGLQFYQKYKETGDIYVASGAAIGSGGTILAGVWGPAAYEKSMDYLRTRNAPQIYTPGIGDKPFIRATPSGKEQAVFYARAEASKWYNPKSWKYRGYKPGQFYERQYRLVDPLVEGKTKGLSSVNYYDIVNGKVVPRTGKVTSFPYDTPSTQKDWFLGKQGGVEQYYLPKKFLPTDIKNVVTGSGYSATPAKWNENIPGLNEYQVYYSGKGASVYFFRSGNIEGSSLQIGGSTAGTKPVLYSSYFENIKNLPGKETVVANPLDATAKGWKQYIFGSPTQQGTLYLPGAKLEVEGVVTGPRVDVGGTGWFKFGGRRIPIQTGAYLTENTLTNLNVPSSSLTGSSSSYVPSSSFAPNVFNLGYAGLGSTSSTTSSSSTATPSQISITPSYSSSSSSIPSYSIISSKVSSSGGSSSRGYSTIKSSVTPSVSKAYSSIVSSSKVSPSTSVSKMYSSYVHPKTKINWRYAPTKTSSPLGFYLPKSKSKISSGGFQVFGRRFGKFKPLGVGRTEREAFSLGKKFASGTLGATFKVPKSKVFKLPGYRTKKTKEGTLFIEPSKRRLKRGSGELPEIQFYKGLKRRSK